MFLLDIWYGTVWLGHSKTTERIELNLITANELYML